jgi:hypothetical protein
MLRGIALLAVLAIAASSPAQALKITNHDATVQKMTINENNGSREQTLAPSESIDGFCNSGCSVKMEGGEEYEFDGNEIVSIEEGLMFLDEPGQGSGETQKQ